MKLGQLLVGIGAILLCDAGTTHAHDAGIPIAGDRLEIRTHQGAKRQRMRFVARGEVGILLGHDPTVEPTWLLVRGTGEYAGSSGRIALDPAGWRRLERDGVLQGYRYVDKAGRHGGVDRVMLQAGRLRISARGRHWDWQPKGAQDEVWVHFGIADESYCARFGGAIKRNGAGSFAAKDASRPRACPESVCGNGVPEPGELCDDGNLDDHDGCTTQCTRSDCEGPAFASTFDALRSSVFDAGGCTNALCHGGPPGQGQLDLSPAAAYQSLLEVPSTGSSFQRVHPTRPRESSLWLKLAKAVDPENIDIDGAPMPFGLPPLDEDRIEAVRLWIEQGAPESGTVPGTEGLLAGCFPEPVPITVTPLQPPDPEEGVQLVMPAYDLRAGTETEICFATTYDWSDTVPERFRDPVGPYVFVNRNELRWDPHSHHLVVLNSGVPFEELDHPSFGSWTCIGGELDGELCEPRDPASCGAGTCRSRIGANIGCIGFGPPGGSNAASPRATLGGSGNGISSAGERPGGFRRVPIAGLVYWNSHAFNLTSLDHRMNARLNLHFTDDLRFETVPWRDLSKIYRATGQPPFTEATYCADYEMAQGARLLWLSSHTHQRGRLFTVDLAGTRIYQTTSYSDPTTEEFDPPLAFDSPDPAQRTLRYCGTFNNGLAEDGSPDPTTVRRRSTTPSNGVPCMPVACAEGRVGAACAGVGDDASCDTAPGAGDGFCDACPITAGVTTEDEMFILLGANMVAVE